jgi:hypothetical protein
MLIPVRSKAQFPLVSAASTSEVPDEPRTVLHLKIITSALINYLLTMTHFFSPRHDFWPIYDHLKRHYPLGLTLEEPTDVQAYPGYQELQARVAESLQDGGYLQTDWNSLEAEVAASAARLVRGKTNGQVPCFSAVLDLGTTDGAEWQVRKELFFAVSLVGPFYTVVGHDTVMFPLDAHTVVRQTAYLTVSPFGAYEPVFDLVCAAIERRFAGHRFVPFMLARRPLAGLYVPGKEGTSHPLFYGLFNDYLDVQARIVGDPGFKHGDWLRPASPEGRGRWYVAPGNPKDVQN